MEMVTSGWSRTPGEPAAKGSRAGRGFPSPPLLSGPIIGAPTLFLFHRDDIWGVLYHDPSCPIAFPQLGVVMFHILIFERAYCYFKNKYSGNPILSSGNPARMATGSWVTAGFVPKQPSFQKDSRITDLLLALAQTARQVERGNSPHTVALRSTDTPQQDERKRPGGLLSP